MSRWVQNAKFSPRSVSIIVFPIWHVPHKKKNEDLRDFFKWKMQIFWAMYGFVCGWVCRCVSRDSSLSRTTWPLASATASSSSSRSTFPLGYCAGTYTHIQTHTPTYTHIQSYTPTYRRIHPHTVTYIQIHPHTLSFTHIHSNTPTYIQIHPHTLKCTHIHPHTSTYIRIHPHISEHTRIHPNTPTYTRIHPHTFEYTHIQAVTVFCVWGSSCCASPYTLCKMTENLHNTGVSTCVLLQRLCDCLCL